MTAINIPTMITILRYHELIPVPVEIDPKTLSPSIEDLDKAYHPKVIFFFPQSSLE